MKPVKPTKEQAATFLKRVLADMRKVTARTLYQETLADSLDVLLADWEERGKDSERLDWLGLHREFDVWYGHDDDSVRLALDDKFGLEAEEHVWKATTLRESVDAAMQKGTKP